MPKRQLNRRGFTLIEVMVAVMIVSVVIAALLQMQGSTIDKFFGIKNMMKTNQYSSLLLSQREKYGFEKSHLSMYQLVEDFDLESDLRRRLKRDRLSLDYKELATYDTSEYNDTTDENSETTGSLGVVFEIGKTIFKIKDDSHSFIRIKIQ